MTADDHSTSETPAIPQAGQGETRVELKPRAGSLTAKPRSALSELGRRISGRTTDLLAIAIVVIGSLTIGRQMLEWWHEEPPAVLDLGPLDNLGAEWGADSRLVALEFGNSPLSMTRQVLTSGGPQVALDAVRERCQQFLVSAGPPDLPLDQAEADQLKAISKLTPAAEQPGHWQLFSLSGGLPMIVGVKTFRDPAAKLPAQRPVESRRVICWGLVFPGLSSGSWTAYTFVKRPASSGDSAGAPSQNFDLSRLELPADSQRTVLMQESGQGGLLGFQGVSRGDIWQRHFTKWFQAQGWQQADGWQSHGGGWSNRFVRREPGRLGDSTIQIHFHPQQTGQSVGLIEWLPARESRTASPLPASRGTP